MKEKYQFKNKDLEIEFIKNYTSPFIQSSTNIFIMIAILLTLVFSLVFKFMETGLRVLSVSLLVLSTIYLLLAIIVFGRILGGLDRIKELYREKDKFWRDMKRNKKI